MKKELVIGVGVGSLLTLLAGYISQSFTHRQAKK
jgi:hypothetical protein